MSEMFNREYVIDQVRDVGKAALSYGAGIGLGLLGIWGLTSEVPPSSIIPGAAGIMLIMKGVDHTREALFNHYLFKTGKDYSESDRPVGPVHGLVDPPIMNRKKFDEIGSDLNYLKVK